MQLRIFIVACLALGAFASKAVETTPYGSSLLLRIAESRPLSSEELGDLALACFSEGKFSESLTVISLAVGQTHASQQKALLYLLKAQNEAALGRFVEATVSAKAAQRYSPDSPAIALLRVHYSEQGGMVAESAAAFDHLKRVDPNLPEPVMDAATVITMGLKLAYQAWVIYRTIETEWPKIKPHVETIGKELSVVWKELNTGVKTKAIP